MYFHGFAAQPRIRSGRIQKVNVHTQRDGGPPVRITSSGKSKVGQCKDNGPMRHAQSIDHVPRKGEANAAVSRPQFEQLEPQMPGKQIALGHEPGNGFDGGAVGHLLFSTSDGDAR